MCNKYDKIFVNCNYIDKNGQAVAGDIAVKDGRIVEIIKNGKMNLDKADCEHIDLENKFIYPGFADSHMHLIAYSKKKLYEVSLNEVTSGEDLVQKVKAFIEEKRISPGDWIIGSGWNQDKFENKKFPDRKLLDRISKVHPINLTRTCYHICVVNSMALELAKVKDDTRCPEGGQIDCDEEGTPTGIIRENAMDLITGIIPRLRDKKTMKELIVRGCEDLAKAGITTVHSDDFTFVEDKNELWEAYKELALEDKLPIRVVLQLRAYNRDEINYYSSIGLKSWERLGKLTVGPIKVLADGSLGSRTAALEKSYEDDCGNKGLMLVDEEELNLLVRESINNDFDITMHAIGDRTMRIILSAYEDNYDTYMKKGLRPSIIHCQIASDDILKRFKRNNVIANIQPIFLNTDWKIAENRIGRDRLKTSYCWKSFMDEGILCVGSSDAPIEDFNPVYGIYTAVARKDLKGKPESGWILEEKLTMKRAVDLFTKNAAYLSLEEKDKGSIEIGKYADFTVLSDDLYQIDTESIMDTEIHSIIIDGNIIL